MVSKKITNISNALFFSKTDAQEHAKKKNKERSKEARRVGKCFKVDKKVKIRGAEFYPVVGVRC